MNNVDEFLKWEALFQENKKLSRSTKKIISDNQEENNDFFSNLRVFDNSYVGRYGIGFNNINSVVVKKIIDTFYKVISTDESNLFLLVSDGSQEAIEIYKDVISFNEKIEFLSFSNYQGYDQNFVNSTIKKINPIGCVYISKSIFNNEYLTISLYDSNGIKMDNNFLNNLYLNIDKSAREIQRSQSRKISFLKDELLIKIYIEKVSNLFPRTFSNKKTKIAISNRSDGITKILSKLIGSQDYSYVINNNLKSTNIDLYNKKHLSDSQIKKFFWKDINFAIRRKANFLIAFNKAGTQTFLFNIEGLKVTYLSPNIIASIFLNKFFNDLESSNKKIPNAVIGSNNEPNKNIKKIINKFKINFKEIQDNNFLALDYLLLFWNDYNQFVFGEKINSEFTIYHLLIKIIEIVNYYNNQYNSIDALLNKLSQMYGEQEVDNKFILKTKIPEYKESLNSFLSAYKSNKLLSINNDFETNHFNENVLAKITLKNDSNIIVKQIPFLKNTIFFNVSFEREYNIFKKIKNNMEVKKVIKQLLRLKI